MTGFEKAIISMFGIIAYMAGAVVGLLYFIRWPLVTIYAAYILAKLL